jgi:hypothetical protein
VEVSPCEGIIPPPIPVLDGVSPIIFFQESPADKTIGVKQRVVLVEKPHTSADIDIVDVELTTDVPFDGVGTFTFSPAAKLKFFRGATQLQFNGTDNVFTGPELTAKVSLRCEGVQASDAIDDVKLTLTLSGGSKKRGGPAVVALTVVEVTLDICEPRTSPSTDPTPLAQPTSNKPAAGAKDKFFGGRGLLVQDDTKLVERAMLIVRTIKPAVFNGTVVLTRVSDHVALFASETPVAGETALDKRITFPSAEIKTTEKRFFVEGVSVSGALRDAGFQLGVEGFDEDADAVSITVVYAEIVSDVEPKDLKLADRVPEKPERKSKSKFFPAPLIVGVNYDIRLRPFTELPAPAKATGFLWSTTAPAAKVTLTDTAKEVLKLKTLQNSAAMDDLTIDLVIDSDIGKFKKSHRMTSVTVFIDPVISGEIPKITDDINFIRNPAVSIIFPEGASADPKKAPIIDAVITPAGFMPDDPRVAWWIVGDQPAGANAYEGRAFFLNSDAAKYGTRVQIAGRIKGDILVQPYSGGFGYGMFRTRVEPLHLIKYRVNILSTDAVPPKGSKPAIPARVPSQNHTGAKKHIQMANLYLRQLGLQLIPDDSAAMPTDPKNDVAGLSNLDKFVVSCSRAEAGHFDVKLNRQEMTFQVTGNDGGDAIGVNGRNEVLVFAYLHSLLQSTPGVIVLAQAEHWPPNHAPGPRADPPKATFQLPDAGTPSTSLIPKTGIPGDTPAGTVTLSVIPASNGLVRSRKSQTKRHEDLMWGITVPTTTMDSAALAAAPTTPETYYGAVLAHEAGHALGLNHRIATGNPYPDGINIPSIKNVMFPMINFGTVENFDIIQAKAVRFSEILFRNP